MGQVRTWFSILAYSLCPPPPPRCSRFVVFWIAHARALKHAGTGLGEHPLYAKLATVALFLIWR